MGLNVETEHVHVAPVGLEILRALFEAVDLAVFLPEALTANAREHAGEHGRPVCSMRPRNGSSAGKCSAKKMMLPEATSGAGPRVHSASFQFMANITNADGQHMIICWRNPPGAERLNRGRPRYRKRPRATSRPDLLAVVVAHRELLEMLERRPRMSKVIAVPRAS